MKQYFLIILLVGVCFTQSYKDQLKKQAMDNFRLRSNPVLPEQVLNNMIYTKSINLISFDVKKDTVIYKYGTGVKEELASITRNISLHGEEETFTKVISPRNYKEEWFEQKISYNYDDVGNIIKINRNFS